MPFGDSSTKGMDASKRKAYYPARRKKYRWYDGASILDSAYRHCSSELGRHIPVYLTAAGPHQVSYETVK